MHTIMQDIDKTKPTLSLRHQNSRVQRYIVFTLLGLGIYTLLPFLILSLFNHPAADDFSFAVRDRALDYLTVFEQYYTTWTGRYFSTITLFRINPMISGSVGLYKVYSFILLLLFCCAVYFVVNTLAKQILNKTRILALTALLVTLYLLQLPSPAEGFYFFSTYATYQVPNILLLLLLVLLYRLFQTQSRIARKLYTGAAAILCIAMIGSNEMALIITFMTVLLLTVSNLKYKEYRTYLMFLFIVCVACCMVAILAPGNYNRMNEHPNAGKQVWSVVYAAFMTALSFYRWLLPILAASVVYILYFGLPLAAKFRHGRLFHLELKWAALYFLGTLFLMNFLFAWSTGERPTPRLENVIYFFFLFGWFYLLQLAIRKYKQVFATAGNSSPVIPAFALAILILSVVSIDSNISTAYTDLVSGKATAYDEVLSRRYTSLAASDCTDCTVAPLPVIPKTLYFADIVSRSEQHKEGNNFMWINKKFAAYWGKTAVFLSAPNPPIQDNLNTLRNLGKSNLRDKKIMK